jgi:hypothetical protein
MQVVKKSSGTFTADEAKEFAEFQRCRSQFCEPFMKAIPVQTGNTNLAASKRKTKFTEPLIPKKKRHYGKFDSYSSAYGPVILQPLCQEKKQRPVEMILKRQCSEEPATDPPPAIPDSELPMHKTF